MNTKFCGFSRCFLFTQIVFLGFSTNATSAESINLSNYKTIIHSLNENCSIPLPGTGTSVKPSHLQSSSFIWRDIEDFSVLAVTGAEGDHYNNALVIFPINQPKSCRIAWLAWLPEKKREEDGYSGFYDRQVSRILGWWTPQKGSKPYLVFEMARVGESQANYSFVFASNGQSVAEIDAGYSPAGEDGDLQPPEQTFRCESYLEKVGLIRVECKHPRLPGAEMKTYNYCWSGHTVIPCR